MRTSVLVGILLGSATWAQSTIRFKVPLEDKNLAARRAKAEVAAEFGRGHLVVQFDGHRPGRSLTSCERGGRLCCSMYPRTVLVSVERSLDLSSIGATYAAPLDPKVKLSPLIDGEMNDFVVEFHPDVNMNEAQGIVLGLGFDLRENPTSVGAKRLLVRRRLRARAGDRCRDCLRTMKLRMCFPLPLNCCRVFR